MGGSKCERRRERASKCVCVGGGRGGRLAIQKGFLPDKWGPRSGGVEKRGGPKMVRFFHLPRPILSISGFFRGVVVGSSRFAVRVVVALVCASTRANFLFRGAP